MVLISGTGFAKTSSGRGAVDCSSMIHSLRYGRTMKRAGLVRGGTKEGEDEDEDVGVGDGGSMRGAGTAADDEDKEAAGFSSPKRTRVDDDKTAPIVGGDGSR